MKFRPGPVMLFLLTLAALGIGLWFYEPQLSVTPIELWLFVPDCPLYAALASLIVLWHFPKNDTWRFVIGSATVLYGMWTVFVLVLNPQYYFVNDQTTMSIVLILGHLGMVVLGLMALPDVPTYLDLGVAMGWLLANTLMDYRIGKLSTHPWIPTNYLPVVEVFTWTGAVLVPVALYYLASRLSLQKKWIELHRMLCWIC